MITNNPDSKDELKPCPLCGSTDLFLRDIAGWELDCRGCELSLVLADDPSREGLVARWNSRASVAAVGGDALLSAMWEALKREACKSSYEAKTVVFLGEEKFRKAMAPFAAASSPAPAEVPQGDDPSHKHYNIPIAMSGDSAEVYYGLESECPICKRQNDDINPAPAELTPTWVDNLVGAFDANPIYAKVVENCQQARREMDAATPPETPAAAMRAAEEIAGFSEHESHCASNERYPSPACDCGLNEKIAAIITRYLPGTPAVDAHTIQVAIYGWALGLADDRLAVITNKDIQSLADRIIAATTSPETTPNYALVQLLNAAMLHPEQAEGYIRRVIAELGDASPETPDPCAAAGYHVCGPLDQPAAPIAGTDDNEGDKS